MQDEFDMSLIIQSYKAYKNEFGYKKYTSDVEVNLTYYHGFKLLTECALDAGEKSLDLVKKEIDFHKLTDGLIVYRRTVAGWGLPYLYVFYKPKEQDKMSKEINYGNV